MSTLIALAAARSHHRALLLAREFGPGFGPGFGLGLGLGLGLGARRSGLHGRGCQPARSRSSGVSAPIATHRPTVIASDAWTPEMNPPCDASSEPNSATPIAEPV